MIVVTTETIPNRSVAAQLGIVDGGAVFRISEIGFKEAFATLFGGEIESYTEFMAQARSLALVRMTHTAKDYGADAVVGVRFKIHQLRWVATEVVAYGTAVKLAESE